MSSYLDKGQTKISVCILRTHGTLHRKGPILFAPCQLFIECKTYPWQQPRICWLWDKYYSYSTYSLYDCKWIVDKNLIAAWMVMVRPALLPGKLTLALRAGNLSRLTNYTTEEKRSRKLTYITRVSVSF